MRRPRPRPRTTSSLGQHGETLAARGLRSAGLRVVARNVRTRFGEIDILARRRRVWVAVEVKTRRGPHAPERSVSPEQFERIQAALRALAPSLRPRPRALRIDVIGIAIDDDGTPSLTWLTGDPFLP